MGDKKRAKDTLSALGTANKLPDDFFVLFVLCIQCSRKQDQIPFSTSHRIVCLLNCLFFKGTNPTEGRRSMK